MTIYLMIDGCKTVKAYENIQLAKQQLDAYMFNLCKQGYRILTTKDGEYNYVDPKDASIRRTLRLTEVELIK
jgi:hypothetical protein